MGLCIGPMIWMSDVQVRVDTHYTHIIRIRSRYKVTGRTIIPTQCLQRNYQMNVLKKEI